MRFLHLAVLALLATALMEAEGKKSNKKPKGVEMNMNMKMNTKTHTKVEGPVSVATTTDAKMKLSTKGSSSSPGKSKEVKLKTSTDTNTKSGDDGSASASVLSGAKATLKAKGGKLKPKTEAVTDAVTDAIGDGKAKASGTSDAIVRKARRKGNRKGRIGKKRKNKGNQKPKKAAGKGKPKTPVKKGKKPGRSWQRKHRGKKRKGGKGEKCQDVELSSADNKYYSELVEGCKQIKSVTLNSGGEDCDCVYGTTFGFDGKRVFVDRGCSGSFRVCCKPRRRNKMLRKALKCRRPFYEDDGRCILVEQKDRVEYVEAAQKCADLGGKLLAVKDLVSKAAIIGKKRDLKAGTYFIGGAKTFCKKKFQLNVSIKSTFTMSLFGTTVSSQMDSSFTLNMMEMFKVDGPHKGQALRRFCTKPSAESMNEEGPLKGKCLAIKVGDNVIPDLCDCDKKAFYICEQMPLDKEDEGCKWSPWINMDTDQDGDENENLCDIIKAAGKGELKNVQPGELCSKPLAMECRAVGTNKLFSPKQTNGLTLIKACTKNSFRCKDMGQTCPDVEVRFKCPHTPLKDCAVDKVRKFCENKGMRCEMTPVGAKCVKVPSLRSGKEIIYKTTCKTNCKTYNVSTCVARGDPHYHSLDGLAYDFQGGCSYVMASTCNNYCPDENFPPFTITALNEKRREEAKVSFTKGFILALNGIKYTFTKGKFYYQEGEGVSVERNFLDYSDNQITITATPNDRNKHTLVINTNFCVQIKWDNRFFLQVRVPDHYMNHICGLCGNYDGCKENDLTLPGGKENVTPQEFGESHLVGGTECGQCVDIVEEPQPCPKEKYEKYTSKQFCGVLNPDGDSPFAKAVVKASETECNIKRLKEIYEECVLDHCWADIPDDDRCHMLEATILEILMELKLQDEKLDKLWREYADCGDKCGDKPNMEYKCNFNPNCQDTCLEPTKSAVCCDKEVTSGCVCKEGFVLDCKMNCVPLDECDLSCNIVTDCGEKVNLKNNETMVLKPCETIVTCVNGEPVEKELEECSQHGQCTEDGQTCKCLKGYHGDGITCIPARPCRRGYIAIGTKCYKLVRDPLDWHAAAINCGADGAGLLRYDAGLDIQVETYFDMLPDLYMLEKSTKREMECCAGTACNIPNNQAAITVKLADNANVENCRGKFRISDDRRQLIVDEGCEATFVVQTIDAKEFSMPKDIVVWVGGNTKVLQYNQRAGKTPFQVDPPRLLDSANCGDVAGCFQATKNCEDQLIVSANPDCKIKLPSVCEYDNAVPNDYDPLDIILIEEMVTYEEAVGRCKAQKRPLASLKNQEQQQKAYQLLRSQKTKIKYKAYISAAYDVTTKSYRWEDGERLVYTQWRTAPDPMRRNQEHFCVNADARKGKWFSVKCLAKYYALCGPPNSDVPLVFTPYYPVPDTSNPEKLKLKLKRAQCQDYICDEPAMIECSAKHARNGDWVTQGTQTKKTLTCTKDKISCRPGRELDCSTLRVRFLCPFEENQCTELKELEAPACTGGQMCFPVTNHYICKCPPGQMYSEKTKECASICGTCSAFGDPHYTTFRGKKYDFMGACTYKFTGLCNPEEYKTEPFFEIRTTNVDCAEYREDGTCVQWIEIFLKNIPIISECGEIVRQDYIVKTKAFEKKYWIDNVEMTDEIFVRENIWKITLRQDQWNVVIHALDLNVQLIGNFLRVQVPARFSGKLCGLCGDCDSEKFRLRNGTSIDVPKAADGVSWDIYTMKILGDDWRVANPYSQFEECSRNITMEECSTKDKLKLQNKKLCGMFLKDKKDDGNFLQECFDKMANGSRQTEEIRRMEFHHDCIYDLCGSKTPEKALCSVLKAFAQQCAALGVTVQWRTTKRCPMKCGKNEEYTTDASCQKQCNQEAGQQDQCDEEPVEGCACKEGFYRRNNVCVPKCECGCRAVDYEGNLVKYLQPGEEVIMPQCTEIVKCVLNDDGTVKLRHRDYVLPCNAICDDTVPPTYKCAKGFKFAEDGVTCIRQQNECTDPYEMTDGICIDPPDEKRIWRQALYRCNQADGTLVHIDTERKISTIKEILVDKKWTSVYVSGRVIAKDMMGFVVFDPLLKESEQGQMRWMNFHFYEGFLDQISLSDEVDRKSIPKEGVELSVVASLEGGEIIFKAVPSTYLANMVCEERPPPKGPDDSEWTPPCNTDSNMEDDGDQETRFNMEMDDNCLVCPRPMELKCENAEGSSGKDGTCLLTPDGLYYSCNLGKSCADKTISTKCHTDVDECKEERDDCPENSQCVNTQGAFKCKCVEKCPLMVRGNCKEIKTCEVKGPDSCTEYLYNLKSFSGAASTYDLDCSYKIVSYCTDEAPMGLPVISVYDTSVHTETDLQQEVYVVLEHRSVGAFKVAVITPEDLEKGRIRYDVEQKKEMDTVDLSFCDNEIGVRFELSQGSKLIIRSVDNFFKVTISFPLKVKVELSGEYSDNACGICTADPPEGQECLVLSDDKLEEISIDQDKTKMFSPPKSCKPRVPPPEVTAEPPTTTSAPETTPAPPPPSDSPVPPPSPCRCDQEYKDFCQELSSMCAVSKSSCEMELCPGKIDICDYLTKNDFAFCNTGSALKAFLKKQECDSVCGCNSVLRYARQSLIRTCANPYGVCAEEATVSGDYGFICVCADGFLLSQDRCVRPEACGCTVKMGGKETYRPPGSSWRSEDCSEIITCQGSGKMTKVQSPCGDNTKCVLKGKKGYICKCKPGFYGNPLKGCQPGDDKPDSVCYDYEDEESGKTTRKCVCKPGYVSDCKNCIDVDECREGFHNCDLSSEKCVNTPGSFNCKCKEGFVKKGGKCKVEDPEKRCQDAKDKCKEVRAKVTENDKCSACVAYKLCLTQLAEEGICTDDVEIPKEVTAEELECIEKERDLDVESGRPAEPVFTSWSAFKECQFESGNCGLGKQVRTREVVPYSDQRRVREVEDYDVTDSRVCFKKCPGTDPADCPRTDVCSGLYPVCGSIGPGMAMTFKSECQLQVKACGTNETAIKVYNGPCSDEDQSLDKRMCCAGPRHEIVKLDQQKNGLHCVGEPVYIGTCQNMLCEGSSCDCCRALEFERIQVTVDCYSKNKKDKPKKDKHVVLSATKCGCSSEQPGN